MRLNSACTSANGGVASFPGAAQFFRPSVGWRRSVHLRLGAVFHDQCARCNQRGNLGVAELAQQPPDIAIERLLPSLLARFEIAADQGRLDARIDGGGVKREQSTFPVARHANLRGLQRRVAYRHAAFPANRPPPGFSAPRTQSRCAPSCRPAGESIPGAVGWSSSLSPGLPEPASLRSMSVGTMTSKLFSARRRAICESSGKPGAKPAICSGV